MIAQYLLGNLIRWFLNINLVNYLKKSWPNKNLVVLGFLIFSFNLAATTQTLVKVNPPFVQNTPCTNEDGTVKGAGLYNPALIVFAKNGKETLLASANFMLDNRGNSPFGANSNGYYPLQYCGLSHMLMESVDKGATWRQLKPILNATPDREIRDGNLAVAMEIADLFIPPLGTPNIKQSTIFAVVKYGWRHHNYFDLYSTTINSNNADDYEWKFVSNIAKDLGDETVNPDKIARQIWEPTLSIDKNGDLLCFYTNESRDHVFYSTTVLKKSVDGGLTWLSQVYNVGVGKYSPNDPNEGVQMPIIAKMGNGKYILVSENASDNLNVHFKISDDGFNWNPEDAGKLLKPINMDIIPKGAPSVAWINSGEKGLVVVTSMFQTPEPFWNKEKNGVYNFVNYNYGEGPWYAVSSPINFFHYNIVGQEIGDIAGWRRVVVPSLNHQEIYHLSGVEDYEINLPEQRPKRNNLFFGLTSTLAYTSFSYAKNNAELIDFTWDPMPKDYDYSLDIRDDKGWVFACVNDTFINEAAAKNPQERYHFRFTGFCPSRNNYVPATMIREFKVYASKDKWKSSVLLKSARRNEVLDIFWNLSADDSRYSIDIRDKAGWHFACVNDTFIKDAALKNPQDAYHYRYNGICPTTGYMANGNVLEVRLYATSDPKWRASIAYQQDKAVSTISQKIFKAPTCIIKYDSNTNQSRVERSGFANTNNCPSAFVANSKVQFNAKYNGDYSKFQCFCHIDIND